MTGKPIKLGRHTYLGLAPDTDPIYKAGWNFLSGKNLSPRSKNQSTEQPEESKEKPEEPAK